MSKLYDLVSIANPARENALFKARFIFDRDKDYLVQDGDIMHFRFNI